MSNQNVEIAEQAIDAFNRTDIEAFATLTTPDFEWSPSMVAIDREIFRGREGIEKYFGHLNHAWEKFHILRDRFRDGGEHPLPRGQGDGFRDSADLVIMLGRLEGRGKVSGVPVDASLGMVFDFRGELISRIRGYLDRGEALRAGGMWE